MRNFAHIRRRNNDNRGVDLDFYRHSRDDSYADIRKAKTQKNSLCIAVDSFKRACVYIFYGIDELLYTVWLYKIFRAIFHGDRA